jgi:hypothetical protein
MEEFYVAITYLSQRASDLLASALRALRGLSSADAWPWLVRASTGETAAAFSLVLFHHLPGLLLATGPEVLRHG